MARDDERQAAEAEAETALDADPQGSVAAALEATVEARLPLLDAVDISDGIDFSTAATKWETPRIGRKAACFARLLSAGAPVPEAFVLPVDLCATLFDAEAPGAHASARAAALSGPLAEIVARAEALAGPGGGGGGRVALRLSPRGISAANAPAILDRAPASLPGALEELLGAWRAPRARRFRAAAGGDDAVAVIVQRSISTPERLERFRRFDPETGAPALSGWLRRLGGDATPGEPIDDGNPPPDCALAAAEAAETALGQPLETEIAIDGDRAWLLSARPLRAAARARVAVAVSMANAGKITRQRALMALDASCLEEILHPTIAPHVARDRIAVGLSASPGAAAGRLCFSAEEAGALARAGEPALLTRAETTPEDVHGMDAAVGVLTTRGGLTSHAAVVARGLGRPCVVGAADARIDAEEERLIAADGRVFRAGDWVTLDGSSGELLAGKLETREAEPTGDLATLMRWADAARRLRVRANADTPSEAETAIRLGVDGVGLCRTEHMFFDPDRITVMREMILADDESARRAALARLLPMQRADFARLFEIMGAGAETTAEARPVTIRLLDPPLHEFLPSDPRGLEALARAMGQPVEKVAKRARDLREFNPMLGKRGCRLGVAFPEIYEMQARAIFEAALNVEAARGRRQKPEIMVPLVSAVRELALLRGKIDAVARAISEERGAVLEYGVGIMIETPRAALRAGPLAEESAFFSFGTNDLTQMTYGLSRDDATRLMRDYVERGVFEADPFQSLDEEGVGELIRMAVERGRKARPGLAIGLCGEHGGSPATIDFCERAGFDYVSCSPYRAPIARLAAAQAAIRHSGEPAE